MKKESDRWYKRIVRDSRYNDRRMKRYINPNIKYIDTETLLYYQNKQQNRCYYCQKQMNWLQRRKGQDGLTLEREKNYLPHYIKNCLGLCCKSCNSKTMSREHGLLVRYSQIWMDIALNVHVKTDGDRSPSLVN